MKKTESKTKEQRRKVERRDDLQFCRVVCVIMYAAIYFCSGLPKYWLWQKIRLVL